MDDGGAVAGRSEAIVGAAWVSRARPMAARAREAGAFDGLGALSRGGLPVAPFFLSAGYKGKQKRQSPRQST